MIRVEKGAGDEKRMGRRRDRCKVKWKAEVKLFGEFHVKGIVFQAKCALFGFQKWGIIKRNKSLEETSLNEVMS